MDRSHRVALPALLILLAGCAATQVPPSVTPSASPTAGASVIQFRADEGRIREHLAALQDIADEHGGIRFAGTSGYEASVAYAADQLRALGFEVTTPEVAFTGFEELPGGLLEVGDTIFRAPDELHALIYSPGGEVTAPVTLLEESGCQPSDFDGVEAGAMVLTVQGGCFRRQQAINAGEAGAVALLVGYPDRGPGEIFRPTLIDPDGITIPVVSVTGDAVRAIEAAAPEPVRLSIATERAPATLRNVIGEVGDGDAVIIAGGHLDSVLDGPGINDNASGVAALLEVARGVAASGVPSGATVRIGLWGGEELGTVGSRAYVDTLSDDVVAYLNLDMAGSLNGANQVYDEVDAADGSAAITVAFEEWFVARGEPTAPVDLGGASDHVGFIAAGIPTGGLVAGATESGSAAQPGTGASGGPPADACYHLACDDIDNVDVARVALFAEAMLAVTLGLAAPR